jgi:chemotaxis protein MotB
MAKRKKKKHQEEEAGEAWLLPYSDLMTLLLAVFIVLFAVSKVDQTKTEQMAEAFRENMITNGGGGILENDGSSVVPLYPDGSDGEYQLSVGADAQNNTVGENSTDLLEQGELNHLEELQSNLDTLFEEEGVDNFVTTSIDNRGLIISLNNTILFDSGSSTIKPENENTLLKIANTINSLDNYIRIEGHTDNIPISTSTYPSNWELSAARATSVVRLFIEKCNIDPGKMVAVGYGEFKPIADNSTDEGRSKNRRIDIIILSERYNTLEE